jgi:hypothetical protein
MKSPTNSMDVAGDTLPRHRNVERPTNGHQSSEAHLFNRSNRTTDRANQASRASTSANLVLINKIGKRVVGMAQLAQDGPHSAKIVLFRIDPEWRHTHITLNLINSIKEYCQDHGQLNVFLPPHVVPPWMLPLMNQHGIHSVT